MAGIPIIIQSGVHGLGVAAAYYKQFPWEPSPAGDLDLKDAKIVEVNPMTFDQLLVELGKSPSGGTVLIVCHAHDESGSVLQSSGLFMLLAPGAGVFAIDDAFQLLTEAGDANKRAKTIRDMPSKTAEEKKAKSDAWIGLVTDFRLGFPPDNSTLTQLDQFFENGLDKVARKELQLPGGARTLKSMLDHVEKVQALKLDRVEFRACKIGNDTATLGHLKVLFGCQKLLAPTARTFYIDHMPVNTIDEFNRLFRIDHRNGHFRPPGSTGNPSNDPDDYTTAIPNDWHTEMLLRNPKTRLFWDVQYGYIPPKDPRHNLGTTTIKMRGPILGMVVEEVAPSWYRAYAAAWRETARHRPLWDDASTFVHQYIMKNAKYGAGDPMIAGFWTPNDVDLPWILPAESDYVDHINHA